MSKVDQKFDNINHRFVPMSDINKQKWKKRKSFHNAFNSNVFQQSSKNNECMFIINPTEGSTDTSPRQIGGIYIYNKNQDSYHLRYKFNNHHITKNYVSSINIDTNTFILYNSNRSILRFKFTDKQMEFMMNDHCQININHCYRLTDGRVGICKFFNKTHFGLSNEKYIGLEIKEGSKRRIL